MILTSEYKKLDIYNIKINIFLFFLVIVSISKMKKS